ncbi:unnamed protein product [Bursaphelenchus okinawaensis]|uniref:Sepiapterin reductase n=1 Tax=Bursaphelenchus okinawaensis TaxID=465554 RepID=A0A811JU45_9BILA|nr:unnamed protein product [Bursaphelenchus okinawaensis]CAG9083017.1 unnamed protein product [Bursaphelenchus okinawaensis]
MGVGGKSLVLVTGASRGIGKEVAIQLADCVDEGSVFVLTARKRESVRDTEKAVNNNGKFKVHNIGHDFFSRDDFPLDVITKALSVVDSVVLIHNAGTVGDVTHPADELTDPSDWNDYLHTNLVSTIVLNNRILEQVKQHTNVKQVTVVNVTSLLAVKAFPCFTQYSVSKTAREAYFRSLALERPDIRVLNYSPGPVDTDMRTDIAKRSYSAEIRSAFSSKDSMEISKSVVTTKETTSKLISILKSDTFENGGRVDYFD